MSQLKEPKARLHRPCGVCDKRFLPWGKSTKICDECREKITKKRNYG